MVFECGIKVMPLNLDEKKAIVDEVRSMANDSLSLVIELVLIHPLPFQLSVLLIGPFMQ